jgi:hypothetical protein
MGNSQKKTATYKKSVKSKEGKIRSSKVHKAEALAISTGFEFQTDQMSFVVVQRDNAIEWSESVSEKTLSDTMIIYGDSLTSHNKRSLNAFTQEATKGGITYYDLLINNKPHGMKVLDSLTNEAEFVITYKKAEKVDHNKEVFLKRLMRKTEDALLEVRKVLEKGGNSKITGLTGYVSNGKRGRSIKVPYETLTLLKKDGEDKYFVAYKVGETVKKLTFYAQCTIGVQLGYVVWALTVLADLYLEMKVRVPDEEEKVRMWKSIVEDSKSLGLADYLYSIYVLFVYSYVSRKNRKACPFIIRHQFSDIFKALTSKDRDTLREALTNVPYKDEYGYDIVYDIQYYFDTVVSDIDLPGESGTPEFMNKKRNEYNTIVHTYDFTPNGINSVVLVEIRYFNRMLNHLKRGAQLKPNNANDYIPLF